MGNRPSPLKPSTVAAALGTWSRTLAPGTVGQVLRQVRQILDAAPADGLVANNAAKSVKAPAEPHRRDVHLTDDDVAALIAATPEHHRALVGAGLRISEACGLQVEEIDFLRRTLRVRQQRRPEAIAGHELDAIERTVGFSVSPHSLRHYFGASLISRGVSVVAVSQLARRLQPRNHLPRLHLPQARRRASRPRRDRQNHAPGSPACVPSVSREGCRVTSTPAKTGLKLQAVLFVAR